MTILLNTRCSFPAHHAGLPFWSEWPLPSAPGISPPVPDPLPAVGTTYTQTQVHHRCNRWLFLEGAVHDGTTYTGLGTITSYGYKIEDNPAVPEAEERPLWWRNGADIQRFLAPALIEPNGFAEYDKTAGFNAAVLLTRDRVLRPVAYTFTVDPATLFKAVVAGTWPFNCGTTVTGEANPPRGPLNSNYRITLERTGPSYLRDHYDADGVLDGSKFGASPHYVSARIAGDATIYRLGLYDAGDHFRASLSPAMQKDVFVGASVELLRRVPMPPGIPHDLLLHCVTYKVRTRTLTVVLTEYHVDGEDDFPEVPEGGTLIRQETIDGDPTYCTYYRDPEWEEGVEAADCAADGYPPTPDGMEFLRHQVTTPTVYRTVYGYAGETELAAGVWGAWTNGATRIVPHLYYSPCEPRSYYAV